MTQRDVRDVVVIDRGAFDARLAGSAEAASAEIRRGCPAGTVTVEPDAVRVTIGQSAPAIRARACVLACGASYRFHRTLGLGAPDVFLQSAQLETPFPARPEIEVRFGNEVAPSGFAWLVPITRDRMPYARIGRASASRRCSPRRAPASASTRGRFPRRG